MFANSMKAEDAKDGIAFLRRSRMMQSRARLVVGYIPMNVMKNGNIDVRYVICPQEVMPIGIVQTAEVICTGLSRMMRKIARMKE